MAVIRRLALVTGASAGIGAAFAKLYAREGYDLALTARRLERLDALAADLSRAHGIEAITIPADLADAGAADAILAAIAARGRVVDVLVNNAGYGLPDTWLESTWPDQARTLQVMLTAPLELAHKVLPGMVERKWGRILNIASLAGFGPGRHGAATYAAVKSALIKFTQSLNVELAGTGVHCTAVCPGLTHSEFHKDGPLREQVSAAPEWVWQSAEQVAEAGYAAAEYNRAIVVTGAVNKIVAGLAKVMPDPLAVEIVRSAERRMPGKDRR
jgi:short-subunit dehydrogenase